MSPIRSLTKPVSYSEPFSVQSRNRQTPGLSPAKLEDLTGIKTKSRRKNPARRDAENDRLFVIMSLKSVACGRNAVLLHTRSAG
jgi:hypothetical protein